MDSGVRPLFLVAELADRLQEGLAFDVANGAADFDDDDLSPARLRVLAHPGLDLVGDVRDGLDRAAQVIAPPLFGDHRLVDLAGG